MQENLSPGRAAVVIADDLGLGGRAYTLDAACASSLYALKLAVDELLAGRADAMLTGGVSRPDSLYTQMGFSQLRRCRRPDGARRWMRLLTVSSSAKVPACSSSSVSATPSATAIACTRSLAGIGLSNDVQGKLLAPSREGQLRAMEAAYRQAGVGAARRRPDRVPRDRHAGRRRRRGGQPERAVGSDRTGRPGQCVIGSVKSNVGHALTAAGSASMIKMVLALRERLSAADRELDRVRRRACANTAPSVCCRRPKRGASRAGRPRRAAINAFGFGGINAHVLLEEWTGCPTSAAVAQGPVEAGDDLRAPDLAIVGRAARVGPWQSAAAVDRRLLGLDHTEPAKAGGPAGG